VKARDLADSDLQLTFWLRAPGGPSAVNANVRTGTDVVIDHTVPATDGWAYVSARGHAPKNVDEMWLTINNNDGAGVDLDDVVLELAPPSASPTAGVITAEGGDPLAQFHVNQIVNGSGEQAAEGVPTFAPTAVQRAGNSVVDALSRLLHEPRVATDSIGLVSSKLAEEFGMSWGTAGWHLPAPLLPLGVLIGLAVLVAVAVAGSVGAILRRRFPAGGFLLFATFCVALATLVRDLPPDAAEPLMGRYLYPGLVAQSAVLAAGLGYYWRWSVASLQQTARLSILGFHALFVATVFAPFVWK
jgi:hypothetical protein